MARGPPTTATARRSELKAKREAAEAPASAWRYDRACAALRRQRIARRASARGAPRAIRLRVPDERTTFDDLVHGPIEFDGANIEDFVILRSDGHPTYHLSVVSDDVEMAITHVVRGDDHISNTPKQCCSTRRSARRCRSLRTCRSSSGRTRSG